MKKCVLGELMEVTRGVSLAGKYYATSGEKVRLTLANFDYSNNCFKADTSKNNIYYTQEVDDRFLLHEGDIITPLTEQTPGLLGTTARIPESGKYIQSQDVALLRPFEDKLDPDFCFYLVSSKSVREQLGAMSQQTKIRHSSPDKIKACTVFLPDIAEQKKIGRFLSTIDRKIALNRKRIATLEAMAKEIYDYWFVQFDFPDANGRPYKSSGGAMVYNPDLKREIPKGWEVKSINDCGEFFRGVAYSHEDEKQCGENTVLVMRGNNIKSGHIVDDSDRVFIEKAIVGQDQLMTKFSVLFAMSSGSKEHVGKTAVYYDYPPMAAYGAFCSKYVPSDSYCYFMFNFLSSSTYRAFVKRICGGTGINNMKEEYFNVPLFALPCDVGQVRKFNELTATVYAQVYNCTQEISKLMSLRDFLLPLLMNGQVKVG